MRLHAPLLITAMAIGATCGPAVSTAAADDAGNATLRVSKAEPYGQYLVDGDGRALYLLKADVESTHTEQEPVSTCYDACAEEWPPFTTEDDPKAGEQADASLLSTTERTGGAGQVTYNGWPLYYYHDDKGAGTTTGQDVHDKWGAWYLVSPAGKPIEKEGEG